MRASSFSTDTPAGRLHLARFARGYKKAKTFAGEMGVPYPTYSMHESGGRGMAPEVVERYAHALNVPPEWLMFGRGDPNLGLEKPDAASSPSLPAETAGARLRLTRQSRGRSARAFAELLGVPLATYLKHEKGERRLPPEAAKKYAETLGISASWLLLGDSPQSSEREKPATGALRWITALERIADSLEILAGVRR